MTVRFLILVVLLVPMEHRLVAQQAGEKDIVKKKQELETLRKEIQTYEKKLRESEKKEKVTLEHLDNLERQSMLIRRLIQKLREEEKQITGEINAAKSSIADLERQLDFLKQHYAAYVRSVYTKSRVYDVELFFSSNSINQLSIRIAYLKRFSEQRAKDLRAIVEKKTTLEQQNEQLQEALTAERALLAEKTKEERMLSRKASQRKTVLSKIRSDKQLFQRELTRKMHAAREVEKMIADLIERERLRKEKEAAAARERLGARTPPPAAEPAGTFEQKRGKLRWPVSGGAIASRFGRQVHPVLKTVTQNTGIDIAVAPGSDVVAVAEGEVSVLSFIPGFGNVLILNHYNGYRTVYAHLSDIAVVETERVNEGQMIAKSGDSPAGSVLHFEIWKDREKQDPEWWLAKQR
jgi:septal ring factor EnvC (AmiA/AmiB activator)